jgi:hypothetical protein
VLKPHYMKPYHAFALVSGIVFLAGCASFQNGLMLDAVGPAPNGDSVPGTNGVVVVYSAFDQHAHFNASPYRRYHTDYKILSEDGKLLEAVHNDVGGVTQDPKRIELQSGRYRIVARANGYGWVTVPVLIAAHRVTTVHLEGGTQWPRDDALASNSVRFPDGRIAGWRAQ